MNRAIVFSVAAIIVALVLGNAYKQKYREADRIVVTGLGEQEFTSDLIVWRGWIIEQDWSLEAAYAKLNANKAKVQKYISEKGISDNDVVFMFVNVNKLNEFTVPTDVIRGRDLRVMSCGRSSAWSRPTSRR